MNGNTSVCPSVLSVRGVHPVEWGGRCAMVQINFGGRGGKNPGSNNKYTKFGPLVIRKISKIIAIRCHILRLNSTKFDSWRLSVFSACVSDGVWHSRHNGCVYVYNADAYRRFVVSSFCPVSSSPSSTLRLPSTTLAVPSHRSILFVVSGPVKARFELATSFTTIPPVRWSRCGSLRFYNRF